MPKLPTSYIILNADVLRPKETAPVILSLSSRVVGVLPGIGVISKQLKFAVPQRALVRHCKP